MSRIHPTAVVDPAAQLGEGVEIGAYAFVGPQVRLGNGVVLRPHAYVVGQTEVGPETTIFSFAAIGEVPQDLKYRGEPTRLVIGARNTVREHVTIHPGTEDAGGLTTVGDDNLIMVGSHIAHDCHLGSHTIIANNVLLAGHIRIEDHAYLAGGAAIQQFLRIGTFAMVAGYAGVMQDIAPFVRAQGHPARVLGVNRVLLKRANVPDERIAEVERAHRIIFRSGKRPVEAFAEVRKELPNSPEAELMVAFLEKSERGFARAR